jgi:hypothetical protein
VVLGEEYSCFWIFRKLDVGEWIGLGRLRIETGDE